MAGVREGGLKEEGGLLEGGLNIWRELFYKEGAN